MSYEDIFSKDSETYLRWLKNHERGTFTGQDILRFYLNNLDPLEKAYVRSYFREYDYLNEVLTDAWRLDYGEEEYYSPLWDLILSSYSLQAEISAYLIDAFMTGNFTYVALYLYEWALEANELWHGWGVYFDSLKNETARVYWEDLTPPWWSF